MGAASPSLLPALPPPSFLPFSLLSFLAMYYATNPNTEMSQLHLYYKGYCRADMRLRVTGNCGAGSRDPERGFVCQTEQCLGGWGGVKDRC